MRSSWVLVAALGVVFGTAADGRPRGDDLASTREASQREQPGPHADHSGRPAAGGASQRTSLFPDGQAWTIEGGMAWGIGESQAVVYVPRGFVHDRTSVPPILWTLASYTRAAVIHDYLYWAQPCSRLQTDNLLMIAMKEDGVPWLRRQLVYRGVRAQGASIWKRNADERALGMPRLNPYGHVPDNLTWPQLRARMFHEGIRDVHHPVRDDYCRYGDSQEIPGPNQEAT